MGTSKINPSPENYQSLLKSTANLPKINPNLPTVFLRFRVRGLGFRVRVTFKIFSSLVFVSGVTIPVLILLFK